MCILLYSAPMPKFQMFLSLLSLACFIPLSKGRAAPKLHHRQSTLVVPATLPGNWSSEGCWTDNAGARTLAASTFADTVGMTIEKCIAFCDTGKYIYAGVEYSQECWCSNEIRGGATSRPLTECNMACKGAGTQPCGGPDRLSLFWSGATPPAGPTTTMNVGDWNSRGCYTDNGGARTLANGVGVTGLMTVQKCTNACNTAGFKLAGVEYAQECYCDNAFKNGGIPAAEGCNMACAGNSTEFCGGPNRLNVYELGGVVTNPPADPDPTTTTTDPQPTTTATDPNTWEPQGCYTDSVAARTLKTGVGVNGPMTPKACTDACFAAGFTLAGTEYATECYCGNQFDNNGTPATSGCDMACAGDATQTCGGPNRLNVYKRSGTTVTTPPPAPTTTDPPPGGPTVVPTVGLWNSLGCYNDSAAARVLANGVGVQGQVTAQSCTTACLNAGFPLAGMEYAAECYCGSQINNGGAPAADGCTMACAGDASQLCGGPNRLNVYNYTGTITGPTNPPVDPPPGGGGGSSLPPKTQGLPAPWAYSACYVDNANGRVLGYNEPDNTALTVESCINVCQEKDYTLAGMEYSVQCFCGNAVINGGVKATNEADCAMPCGGDNTVACGGPDRMSIYSSTTDVTSLPVPVTQTTNLPGKWQYSGCTAEPGAIRVLPYPNILATTNSPTTCLNLCAQYGYPAAGLEYGEECWCGDIDDVQRNGGTPAPEADCAAACTGDPIHICGNGERLSLYTWNDTETPLYKWDQPQNTGRYEFLLGGVVIPLLTSLGVNNKVTFVEKFGTGPPNSTGAYELDLSLTGNPQAAWREMHVKTDVFCSGGLTLPDKAGRQLNVGGWSLDSTYGIRLYTPDGSAGVPGTNDWEEDFTQLKLQRGRWYPGAVVLANGSILVVGGEQGSNGAPEPTLEILPTPAGGPTYLFMEWLQRTDPDNLYPYLWVLPGGGVFVQYYNEARILDENTFATVKTLPNLPGAVNNPLGGRTYPLEGTAMMLPQVAPYTDPVEILVCGGSTPFQGVALDNCVSIAPEATDATWAIERMPSKRVMSCMVAMPDGTYMIMNGAMQGVAGFGLAINPNYQAVLYDPSKPKGQRMSTLASTDIARMYHSEAILLQDGRVLVSGSDPEDQTHPQEYRVEVYVPPYLTNGQRQPEFTITNTDWEYNGQYQVNVNLFAGGNVRVSLLGAVTSTHGISMGQRTIFPAVSCSGATCTITAPPNAHVCPPGWFQLFVLEGPTPSISQWVRIGGDPARLGEWPNVPGFTPPGM